MLRTNPTAGGVPYSESIALQLTHPATSSWIASNLDQLAKIRQAYPAITDGAVWETIGRDALRRGANPHAMVGYLSFLENGQQVFVVGPMLQQLLEMTSLENVDLADVRMPYKAFYVALPDTEYKIHHDASGEHRLAGVYVTQMTDFDGRSILHLLIWGPPHPGRPPWDDALFHYTFRMSGVLRDGISDIMARVPADQGHNAPLVAYVTKMVIALALYLSTPDAEKGTETQYSVSRPERRRLEGTPLGRIVNTPRQVTVIAPTVERRATPAMLAELRNPVRQHWVRGHWHGYWVGSGEHRSLVSKWVQPFKRGAGTIEALQERVYSIKKD